MAHLYRDQNGFAYAPGARFKFASSFDGNPAIKGFYYDDLSLAVSNSSQPSVVLASYSTGFEAPAPQQVDGVVLSGNASTLTTLNIDSNSLAGGNANALDGRGVAIAATLAAGTVTVSGNDVTGFPKGITVAAGNAATISNNTPSIHGNAIGIDVDGGSASITGNHIYDNGIGVRVQNSGTVTDLDTNDFDGGAGTDNGIDLQILASAGTVAVPTTNAFAGDTYFIDDQSTQSFNLVGQGNTLDETDNFRIEDKMYHKVDNSSLGLITWVAGNVYVTAPGTFAPVPPTRTPASRAASTAASDGDTVNVEAGNYAENVLVDKSVTIDGAGPDAGGTVVQPTSVGFTITADDVTLQDMLVQGDSMTAPGGLATTHGVVFNATVDDATLKNLVASLNNNGVLVDMTGAVTNLTLDQVSLNSNGDGFYVAATGTVDGMTVTGSHFDGNLYGFAATADSNSTSNEDSFTGLSVDSSTFNNNARKGIYVEKLNDAVFYNITVDQSGISTAYTDCAGVDINLKFGNYADIEVRNSTISASGTGSPVNGVGLTIKARDTGGAGGIYGTNPATLTDVTVANNFITGNQTGIRFGEPGQTNAGPTDVQVHENSITGNILSGLNVQSLGAVDASGNWWGSPNGPDTALNTWPGVPKGDNVIGTAIIAPWLTDGTDTDPRSGLPTGAAGHNPAGNHGGVDE